jgi:hypothetical protein
MPRRVRGLEGQIRTHPDKSAHDYGSADQMLARCAGLGATHCSVMAPARDLEDSGLTWNMPIDGGLLVSKEIRIEIDLEAVL